MTCMNVSPYNLLEYEDKNGIIYKKEDKLAIIKNTLIYKNIFSGFIYPNISQEKKFQLLFLYLKEMKRELNTKYPGIKFIFLLYNRTYSLNVKSNLNLTNEMLDQIKQLDIEVIDLEAIFGKQLYNPKYRYVGNHPSSYAWEQIVPEIIKLEKI